MNNCTVVKTVDDDQVLEQALGMYRHRAGVVKHAIKRMNVGMGFSGQLSVANASIEAYGPTDNLIEVLVMQVGELRRRVAELEAGSE